MRRVVEVIRGAVLVGIVGTLVGCTGLRQGDFDDVDADGLGQGTDGGRDTRTPDSRPTNGGDGPGGVHDGTTSPGQADAPQKLDSTDGPGPGDAPAADAPATMPPNDGPGGSPTPLARGQACSSGTQCASGFCADGVCCDSACTGGCVSCRASATGRTDGECGPAREGTDPDSDCDETPASTCGQDGQCDGQGACRKHGTGTTCAAESCSGGMYTPQRQCNGQGACAPATTRPCAPYVCDGSSRCKMTCAGDQDCAAGSTCAGGSCTGKKAIGQSCGGANDCLSGHCVDGVCCDGACTGKCQACANSKTGQSDGTCAPIKNNTDPDNECTASAESTCGQTGMCDGSGGCRLHGTNVVCAGETCSGSTYTPARYCTGAGACGTAAPVSCGLYTCGVSECRQGCGGDADCTASAYCQSAACAPRKPNGGACSKGSECASGFCAPDGACCDRACNGQCEACTLPNKLGTCALIPAGQQPQGKPKCGGSGTCQGSCPGNSSQCAFPTTQCRSPTCTNGQRIEGANCDGAGSCPAEVVTSCNNFDCDWQEPTVCSTDRCKTGYAYCSSQSKCEKSDALCFVGPYATTTPDICTVKTSGSYLYRNVGSQGENWNPSGTCMQHWQTLRDEYCSNVGGTFHLYAFRYLESGYAQGYSAQPLVVGISECN